MLSDADRQILDATGCEWTSQWEGDFLCIILVGYRLPTGLRPEVIDLLVRLPRGFPDAAPDMFWTTPGVVRVATNTAPPASEHHETYAGRVWQRFSRHLAAGAWNPSRDSLQTWLAAIRRLLERDAA